MKNRDHQYCVGVKQGDVIQTKLTTPTYTLAPTPVNSNPNPNPSQIQYGFQHLQGLTQRMVTYAKQLNPLLVCSKGI